MRGPEAQRLLGALVLIVTALFVASGTPGADRWRSRLRLAAIIGFGIAVLLALAEIGLWLANPGP